MADENGRYDPSPRTIETMVREIDRLDSNWKDGLLQLEAKIGARLDGMDKAISLASDDLKRFPTDIDRSVVCLKDVVTEKFNVFDEKFRGVSKQFELSEDAVDAALATAKEAVSKQHESSVIAINKSETATAKQIDQLGTLINTMTNGINDKIDDVKTRLTTIEGRSAGMGAGWGYLVAGGGVLIAIVSMFINFTRLGQ